MCDTRTQELIFLGGRGNYYYSGDVASARWQDKGALCCARVLPALCKGVRTTATAPKTKMQPLGTTRRAPHARPRAGYYLNLHTTCVCYTPQQLSSQTLITTSSHKSPEAEAVEVLNQAGLKTVPV